MSYITIPRLTIPGNFLSDMSTVNNDVRHYDTAMFELRVQVPKTATEMNGWCNPDGTGNFQLLGLRVTEALAAQDTNPTMNAAVGLFVNAQKERSSCKISISTHGSNIADRGADAVIPPHKNAQFCKAKTAGMTARN